jgi:hypothetical protein
MGRNYFSKHGGPYFINDGLTGHDHEHKTSDSHEDIKPDTNLLYGFAIGVLSLLIVMGTTLILF